MISYFALQVIFTPSSPANLAGGNGSIFRVHPTPDTYAQAVTGFVEQFGWKRLSVLTSEGSFFSKVGLILFHLGLITTLGPLSLMNVMNVLVKDYCNYYYYYYR